MPKVKDSLRFPHDLLRFLHWIFFRPFTLRRYLHDLDPTFNHTSALFTRIRQRNQQYTALTWLATVYIWLIPGLLGIGLGSLLDSQGVTVNWLNLILYLVVGNFMSLSFSLPFCVAFVLPYSLAVVVLSTTGFNLFTSVLFSFALGLAYGLTLNPAKWAFAGGIVYGVVFGFLSGPLGGLMIGTTFLAGYFRIPLYLIEALLSFILSYRVGQADAARRWHLQPVTWDELIWLPLPGLDRHLQALADQNDPLSKEAFALTKDSFRQRWAVKRARSQG